MNPQQPPEGIALAMMVVVAFAVLFPAFWCLVVAILSAAGGWGALANAHPGTGSEVVAARYRFASGSLGLVNYRATLDVGVGDWGFGLSVARPFRFRHPPIAVPWPAVASCAAGRGLWPGHEIRLDSGARIVLRGQAGAAVEEAWRRRQSGAAQALT